MAPGKNKQNNVNKECYMRMNFLYQASMLMAGKNNTLSSYYGQLCKTISKRAVLRIEPNIKRNLCKRCSLCQQPGITCDLEIAKKMKRRRKTKTARRTIDDHSPVEIICKLCGYHRKFIVNTNYKFWLENPDSVAEICTYEQKTEECGKNTAPGSKKNKQK